MHVYVMQCYAYTFNSELPTNKDLAVLCPIFHHVLESFSNLSRSPAVSRKNIHEPTFKNETFKRS